MCSICDQQHEDLPLSYSVKAPQAVASIPVNELEQRVVLTPDQCVIDGRDFYLRGRIPIPVDGLSEPFIWGVWAEVSPKTFMRTDELWSTEGRENEPPFTGWIDTQIFPYGNTINVEVFIHTQPVGQRPQFEISDPEHPLAIEQREGITMERVQEIAETILHPDVDEPA